MRAIPPNRQLKFPLTHAVRFAAIAATILGVPAYGWCETTATTSQAVAETNAPQQRASTLNFVTPPWKSVLVKAKAAPQVATNTPAAPTPAARTPAAASATPTVAPPLTV